MVSQSSVEQRGAPPYLGFEVDCGRANQVAVVVGLLHGRGGLLADHGGLAGRGGGPAEDEIEGVGAEAAVDV